MAVVSWRCPTELPEKWDLTCTDPDGVTLPVTVNPEQLDENSYYCSASVSGVIPGVPYTLRLTALGMFQPITLEIKDETVYMNGIEAEAGEGWLELRWSPSREPAGGWIATAAAEGDEPQEIPVTEDSCRFPVLPELDYVLTVRTADGSTVDGETSVSIRSKSTGRFGSYGVSTSGATIGTYNTPTKEDWTVDDLKGGTVRFHHDDSITFLVTVKGNIQEVDEEITIHYVIRDNSGNIVHTDRVTAAWNSLWNNRQWYDQIPWLPETPGKYSFTVYLNGQRIGTINFTLIQ